LLLLTHNLIECKKYIYNKKNNKGGFMTAATPTSKNRLTTSEPLINPKNQEIRDKKIQIAALSAFGLLFILSGLPIGIGFLVQGASTAVCLGASISPMIIGGILAKKAKKIEDELERIEKF